MWLSTPEALARLGSKTQTLYANVSRGRIRAKPDPADSRRSLYSEEDVDRLATRARGRQSAAMIASQTIDWGDPVLASGISTISAGRLYYRGRDAVDLSNRATLEEVASLLWDGPWQVPSRSYGPTGSGSIATAFSLLVARMANDATSQPRSLVELRAKAASVLACIADGLLGNGEGPLHQRLAASLGQAKAIDPLRRTLVLLADHELNTSTFTARVTVSSGSSIAAGALAGMAALVGPAHGNAAATVQALADDLGAAGPGGVAALRDWLGEGRVVPGFGHRLYPGGDVRANALLAAVDVPPAFQNLAAAVEEVLDSRPNIDFALAAMAAAHQLPRTAPITIFALARSVGWIAHMLEQIASGRLIRPRARYIGPPVEPVAGAMRR